MIKVQTSSKHEGGFDVRTKWGTFHWRKCYYVFWTGMLAKSDCLKLKVLHFFFFFYKHSFSLHRKLIDGLKSHGLLVDYCEVFISYLNPHSDGTHSLQKIYWWAIDELLNNWEKSFYAKSVPMKKETHLYLGWPKNEDKCSFLVEIFL